MSKSELNELIAAAASVLPDLRDEVDQRQHSGNDEYWRGLDEKTARLDKAVSAAKKHLDACAGR